MKTSFEHRQAWKMKRRFAGWRKTLASMKRRARRSKKTLLVMQNAIEGADRSGLVGQVQDALRRAS